MARPFVIFALPRSRTAWVARYLTYKDWACGHEEIRHLRSLDDVKSWFSQPNTGTVETAAAPWWRLLPRYAPDASVVVIRRPVEDVIASLMAQPLWFDGQRLQAAMQRMDQKLDQIAARVAGVLSVNFSELACEASCARLFEHCLPYDHDHDWWAMLAERNIQINLMTLMRYMAAYAPQMTALGALARAQTIADMRPRRREIDGFVIQDERWDDFWRDGQPLVADHLVRVGQPGADKDIERVRLLNEVGALQITTARSNGRMFGYIMMLIGPSLEEPGTLAATNLTTYAAREVPGLGMQLHRAAIDRLRESGVAGVLYQLGDQPKLASLYRRLGAVPCGEQYLLGLH